MQTNAIDGPHDPDASVDDHAHKNRERPEAWRDCPSPSKKAFNLVHALSQGSQAMESKRWEIDLSPGNANNCPEQRPHWLGQ